MNDVTSSSAIFRRRRFAPHVFATADAMTPGEFIAKWRVVELKERSAAQSHFNDLCRLLGEPTPTDADPRRRVVLLRGARTPTRRSTSCVSACSRWRIRRC